MYAADGTEVVFKRYTCIFDHIPYLYMLKIKSGLAMLHMVRNHFEGFTKKQIEKSTLASEVQAMIGYPTDSNFKYIVRHRALSDFPVTFQEVSNSLAIFGPGLSGVCGKTVRCRPETVDTTFQHITNYFYALHKFVTLNANVMFVIGVTFLTTLSIDIRMLTDEHLNSLTSPMIIIILRKVAYLYALGDFIVLIILMDMEFEEVKK